MSAQASLATRRRALWSCSRWAGGRHWYASIGLLNPDGAGYEWRTEHRPKFESHERALMWIEREFQKLGPDVDLFDYMELIEGIAGMRHTIRAAAGKD
jgi:hypothetical protein